MNNLIELANVEINEYCVLNKETGEISFSNKNSNPNFTGLYFKDEDTFFAIYPTCSGPQIFYMGKEYKISKDLSISLYKHNKYRKFSINDYNIHIEYTESPYIGFDVWSGEIDLDLFFMIEQQYKKDEFYKKYSIKDNQGQSGTIE